jgi:hypothetical protein
MRPDRSHDLLAVRIGSPIVRDLERYVDAGSQP